MAGFVAVPIGVAFATVMAFAIPAVAQPYPAKPVELTVHTSAGSGGDLVSRLVSEIVRREKILPQPLMVVNRVGGSGVTAFTFFKEKRGDPYHMLSVTGTLIAMAYRPDVNIGLENYTPLALMAIDPQTIMVPADSPYKTFKELMEAARKRSSRSGSRTCWVSTASTGSGHDRSNSLSALARPWSGK